MRPTLDPRLPVLCPVCRSARMAQDGPDLVRCAGESCGAERPVVDGVPLIVADWAAYWERERWVLLRRRDLPAHVERWMDAPLGDDDPERVRAGQLLTYLRADYAEPDPAMAGLAAEFPDFVKSALGAHSASLEGGGPTVGVDLGCATGGYTRMLAGCVDVVCGIDLHFERLRAAREIEPVPGNASFVVADAHAPPLMPESVDVLLALNLLDSINRPRTALLALDSLVKPGGLLLLSSPFAYSTVYSQRQEWVAEDELKAWLGARYEILDWRERLPWVLPVSERRHETYLVTALAARKR